LLHFLLLGGRGDNAFCYGLAVLFLIPLRFVFPSCSSDRHGSFVVPYHGAKTWRPLFFFLRRVSRDLRLLRQKRFTYTPNMARHGKKQWRKPLIWTPLNLDTSLMLAFPKLALEVYRGARWGIGNPTFFSLLVRHKIDINPFTTFLISHRHLAVSCCVLASPHTQLLK
jgi:hypothetical protein